MKTKTETEHDELLARVIRLAQEHDGDEPTPIVRDGIEFYRVGHNASHEFYLGVKDGVLYDCAVGEDIDPPPTVEKCERFPGYVGHL